MPEFFLLMSIDLLLAASILSVLLERYFPAHTPYIYQIAAVVGFGQLWVSKEFLTTFGVEMRFWYSILFLLAALGSEIGMNAYLAVVQKRIALAGLIFNTVTLPALLGTAYFLGSYVNGVDPSMPQMPVIALSAILGALLLYYVGLVAIRFLPELRRRLSRGSEEAKGGEVDQ